MPSDRPLTPRQCEILNLAATGASVPDIALELGISAGTVYERLFFIRSRLNAQSNGHAAALAAASGQIEVGDEEVTRVLEPVFERLQGLRGSRGQSFFSGKASRERLAKALSSSQRSGHAC